MKLTHCEITPILNKKKRPFHISLCIAINIIHKILFLKKGLELVPRYHRKFREIPQNPQRIIY